MHGHMWPLPDTEAGGNQLYMLLSLCPPAHCQLRLVEKVLKIKLLVSLLSLLVYYIAMTSNLTSLQSANRRSEPGAQFPFRYCHHPPPW
jgi:hypothetical protein